MVSKRIETLSVWSSLMGFHNVLLIRKIEITTRAAVSIEQCKSSWRAINSVEMQSASSRALNATVIALLDRDSELRHVHLQRRWQGVMF